MESRAADRVSAFRQRDTWPVIFRSRTIHSCKSNDGNSELFEQYLRHHPLIFVIQQVTMKHRHALDGGIGKVQDDIDAAVVRDIHGVQPYRVWDLNPVFRIGQKVDLMYVKGMQLGTSVHNTPMLVCTDASAHHR